MVWLGQNSPRLSRIALTEIEDARNSLYVSAIIAWEFAELNARGRFGADLKLGDLLKAYGVEVLSLPAELWCLAEALPPIHRDPVDRMLVAHALHADMTVVTADRAIRDYPIATLW
ncbi:MAG: type II toxin-antitoxin system VapC family toxin [Candidatus Saccharimonas sp.]|nr:type II toxin-antitoxin system VapC family toxin [Planctomycetaceae bacterium]